MDSSENRKYSEYIRTSTSDSWPFIIKLNHFLYSNTFNKPTLRTLSKCLQNSTSPARLPLLLAPPSSTVLVLQQLLLSPNMVPTSVFTVLHLTISLLLTCLDRNPLCFQQRSSRESCRTSQENRSSGRRCQGRLVIRNIWHRSRQGYFGRPQHRDNRHHR